MSLPLKRDYRFHQGYYKVQNISKYIGNEPPVFRSGIELKFFKFCDSNPNVLHWSSENIPIPYRDTVQHKNRTYYVDNFVEIKEGNTIKKYLVELKDHKETKKPDPKSKQKKSTKLYQSLIFENNCCKWKYAMEFAKKNNMEFLLLAHSQKDGFQSVKLDFL